MVHAVYFQQRAVEDALEVEIARQYDLLKHMPIVVVSKTSSGDLRYRRYILSHPGKMWGLVHVCGNPECRSGLENIKGHASKRSRSHEYVKFTCIRCKWGSGYIPRPPFLNPIALAPTIFYHSFPLSPAKEGYISFARNGYDVS